MIDMIDVKSSNVKQLGYDEKVEELHVIFKNNEKWKYIYSKVPTQMNHRLMTADSVGGFLNEYFVKPKWEFRKERL